MKDLPDCNYCKHLNITEHRQDEAKHLKGEHTSHFCKKYRERLFHYRGVVGLHTPEIEPSSKCTLHDRTGMQYDV